MLRGAILLVVLLLLAAVGWFVATGHTEPFVDRPLEDASAHPTEVAPALANATSAPALQPDAERSAVTASGDQPSAPADAKWVEVLVVDKADGKPIVAADVDWTDGSQQEQLKLLPPVERNEYDAERIALEFGGHARSNQDGKVRVRIGPSGTQVFGRQGSRHGSANLRRDGIPPPGGFQVELEQDCTLRVQVVDALGQPVCGVPVQIVLYGADGKLLGPWNGPLSTRRPGGLAEFRHLQQTVPRMAAKAAAAVSEYRVALRLTGLDAEGTAFEPTAPPAEPIVLRLPPTGIIVARVTHEGRELKPRIGLHAGTLADWKTRKSGWNVMNGTEPDPDGRVRFAHVPLGRTFVLHTQVSWAEVEREVAGPTFVDQQLEIELVLGNDILVFTGRVLDPAGHALANSAFNAGFKTSSLNGSAPFVETDADGRFTLLTGRIPEAGAELQELTVFHTPAGGTTLRASAGPMHVRAGRNDVGDLRLASSPLVVAGRLVFDRTEPTRQVPFSVQRFGEPNGRNRDEWGAVNGLTYNRLENGAFEIRGETMAGRHRLHFDAQGHLPVAPIEFVLGSKDLEIAISFGAPLSASCLVPEGMPSNLVHAVLRTDAPLPPESPDRPGWSRMWNRFTATARAEQGPGVVLQWQALPEATYSLEVRCQGFAERLAVIEGVQVPVPPEGDARLLSIDLRDKIRFLIVRVPHRDAQPEDGRSMVTTMVFPMPQDPAKAWEGHAVVDGELHMPVPAGPIDMLVVRQGMQPKQVRGAERDVTVILDPWPTVEVTFAGLPALPEGYELRARLSDAGPPSTTSYTLPTGGGSLGPLLRPGSATIRDGRAALPIAEGAHSLSVHVRHASRGARALKSVVPNAVLSGASQVAVQLSSDEIGAAVKDLEKGAPPR